MISFKQFIETVERKPDLFSTLKDELGISPEDILKFPQVGLNFSLGKLYNIGTIEIMDFARNDRGKLVAAKVKVIKDPSALGQKMYIKSGKKYIKLPGDIEPDEKIYTIPASKLQQLIAQGLSQQSGMPMGELPGGGGGGLGGLL